ncbi:hypothetical protein GLOIN_2v1687254 [Rhizophagus clarus]|uniref:Uncharacterized protein n=1 Tax=Rhizophagus clarus TaxID=94130 RepID=A0A8H3LI72_9GLOM|nr:hypothetical protein GLOIN_2v1687254 [Rhizophagus clarus]
MRIVKRTTISSRSCKSSRRPRMSLGGREIDNDRFFTLKSLGAPENVRLPVEIIERQKFSETSINKFSAGEILRNKREDLKKKLKDFFDVAFPSSTSPYRHLMTNPGPITNLQKFYIANQSEYKPPKYKVYFDTIQHSYYFSLEFNDNIEFSDAMPIKILAKLQVAHKALMRIRRQMKEKAVKEKAEKEKAAKEKMNDTMLMEVDHLKDHHQKRFYLHPRVQKLWTNKMHESNNDSLKNINYRNFTLFKEFYANITESEITLKRKSINLNKEVIKKTRIKNENVTSKKIADDIPESVAQEFQPTDELNIGSE